MNKSGVMDCQCKLFLLHWVSLEFFNQSANTFLISLLICPKYFLFFLLLAFSRCKCFVLISSHVCFVNYFSICSFDEFRSNQIPGDFLGVCLFH